MQSQGSEIAGIVVADANAAGCPLIYVSPGFEELTGYRAEEVLGRSCSLLQGPDTDPAAIAELGAAIAEGRDAYVTLRNYRRDGRPFWNEVALAAQRDADGQVVRYLGVQKDVTGRINAARRMHELAYHDSLTGLANRATLQDELSDAVDQAAGSDGQLALLFIDLDDFKDINDTHGHAVGDGLLRLVGERLRSLVRAEDVLARQGGDEFLILVRGVQDAETLARDLAERLLDALRAPFLGLGPRLRVQASVGVSTYPRDAGGPTELLAHADAAMYLAKRAGKGQMRLYRPRRWISDPPPVGFDPTEHADELARILDREDLTAAYQPIVDIATEEVVGFEALARGPQGSPLQFPDRLFATAAAAGRTDELDWLCRIVAIRGALQAGIGRRVSLFLNCEPSAVGSPCPQPHRELWSRAHTELDLVLEITERALTARPAELCRLVDEQRAAGCAIAVDDVGADVRSLALMPLLAPELIKLDLRLVQGRPSAEQAAIVSATSAESERTGAIILAEGIENETHLAVARALGASLGQGWHWGRPGPLPRVRPSHWRRPSPHPLSGEELDAPFDVVSPRRTIRHAEKQLLLPMSHHLENRAEQIGEGAVILSTFQHVRHFTPRTANRYARLARGASLVAAFAVGLSPEPAPNVRGADLAEDDRLAGEWSVVVLGPHFAGALLARDLGDVEVPDARRTFEYAMTYDRGLVVEAARTLMRRILPLAAEPAEPPGRKTPAPARDVYAAVS